MSSQSVIAIADPMRRGCPARPPSPQKSPGFSMGYRSFLAFFRDDGESHLALLDVEDCVSRVPLREDCLFPGNQHNFPTPTDGGKEPLRVEIAFLLNCNGSYQSL